MLPAIDHAHLVTLQSVDTGRVSKHHRKKGLQFSMEMTRLQSIANDRPAPPTLTAPQVPAGPPRAARGKLAPLGGVAVPPRRLRDAFGPVRGIDSEPTARSVSLDPLDANVKAARAKIMMMNPARPVNVKPLPSFKVQDGVRSTAHASATPRM
jgi:hypothetical protein